MNLTASRLGGLLSTVLFALLALVALDPPSLQAQGRPDSIIDHAVPLPGGRKVAILKGSANSLDPAIDAKDCRFYYLPLLAPIRGRDKQVVVRASDSGAVQLPLLLGTKDVRERIRGHLNALIAHDDNREWVTLSQVQLVSPERLELSTPEGYQPRVVFSGPKSWVITNDVHDFRCWLSREDAAKFAADFRCGEVDLYAKLFILGRSFTRNSLTLQFEDLAKTNTFLDLDGHGRSAVVHRGTVGQLVAEAVANLHVVLIIENPEQQLILETLINRIFKALPLAERRLRLQDGMKTLMDRAATHGFDPHDLEADILKIYRTKANSRSGDARRVEEHLAKQFESTTDGSISIASLFGGGASHRQARSDMRDAILEASRWHDIDMEVNEEGTIFRPKSMAVHINDFAKVRSQDRMTMEVRNVTRNLIQRSLVVSARDAIDEDQVTPDGDGSGESAESVLVREIASLEASESSLEAQISALERRRAEWTRYDERVQRAEQAYRRALVAYRDWWDHVRSTRKTGVYGGSSGQPFTSPVLAPGEHITRMTGAFGGKVDRLGYEGGGGSWGPTGWGNGGQRIDFRIPPGDRLVKIIVEYDHNVDRITLVTQQGRSASFGGNGGRYRRVLYVPGHEIVGLYGRSARLLDALGIVTRPIHGQLMRRPSEPDLTRLRPSSQRWSDADVARLQDLESRLRLVRDDHSRKAQRLERLRSGNDLPTALCGGAAVAAARFFQAYAAPSTWGPWVKIASHGGRMPYSIRAWPLGKTNIVGQVRYHSDRGLRVETFYGSTNIRTGNVWSNVYVRFKGMPLGSAVRGIVK